MNEHPSRRMKMPGRDPFTHGPSPLLSEKDRPRLDALIDRLTDDLAEAIRARVIEGADALFDQGYYLRELRMSGFGNEIEVFPEPLKRHNRLELWLRRMMMRLRLKPFELRDYAAIESYDYDTARLLRGLKIFDPPERKRLP